MALLCGEVAQWPKNIGKRFDDKVSSCDFDDNPLNSTGLSLDLDLDLELREDAPS